MASNRGRYSELTAAVIGACFDVANELGRGYLESVYESALIIALTDRGLEAFRQVPLEVHFREQVVGKFYADVVVADKVIVELKAVGALTQEHSAQLINYLKGTGMEVGLLVNFGAASLQHRRCWRPDS